MSMLNYGMRHTQKFTHSATISLTWPPKTWGGPLTGRGGRMEHHEDCVSKLEVGTFDGTLFHEMAIRDAESEIVAAIEDRVRARRKKKAERTPQGK